MGLLIVSPDLDLIDTICDDKINLKDINNISTINILFSSFSYFTGDYQFPNRY